MAAASLSTSLSPPPPSSLASPRPRPWRPRSSGTSRSGPRSAGQTWRRRGSRTWTGCEGGKRREGRRGGVEKGGDERDITLAWAHTHALSLSPAPRVSRLTHLSAFSVLFLYSNSLSAWAGAWQRGARGRERERERREGLPPCRSRLAPEISKSRHTLLFSPPRPPRPALSAHPNAPCGPSCSDSRPPSPRHRP